MNSVPDLHREEKDAINRDTGHSSTVLTHVFNTGRDHKGNKPDSDQNCPQISGEAEPPAQSQQKKGKTGTCEATLTDVFITQLKD